MWHVASLSLVTSLSLGRGRGADRPRRHDACTCFAESGRRDHKCSPPPPLKTHVMHLDAMASSRSSTRGVHTSTRSRSSERSRTTNTRRRLLQTLIADITAARSDPWPKLAPPWGGPKKRLSRSADHLKSGMSTPLTSPEASTNLEPDTTPESTYLVSFVEAASSLMAAFAPALSPAYLTKAKRLSG